MKKDRIVTVRFDQEAYNKYSAMLKERGLCTSEVIRTAFVMFMENNFIRKGNTLQTKKQ